MTETDPEFGRDHLCNLGIEALPHLGTAMIHQHRAVGVNMHQRASLIVVNHVERNTELHRRERQPFFEHRARGIKRPHRFATFAIVAARFQLSHEFVDDVVFDGHPVVCGVARGVNRTVAIKIQLAHVERVFAQLAGDAVDDVFHHNCALRTAEPAERCVGLGIGFGGHCVNINIAQVVGAVHMAQRARGNGTGQVRRKTGAHHHVDPRRKNQPIVVESDIVFVMKAMAFAGDHHVVVAIQPQLYGPVELARRDRCHAGEQGRLGFLAAKSTPHPANLNDNLVRL